MIYRKSSLTPPKLLLRIAATAGTGALVGAVACRSEAQCLGLCGPFGDDAPSGSSSGGGTSAAGGPACPEIPPAAFDQSCTVASDCIAVALGNVCVVCPTDCPTAAINKSNEGQYHVEFANSNGTNCGCTRPPPVPCCVDGMCQIGSQCESSVQATDAAADTASSDSGDAGADVVAFDDADAGGG